MLVMHLHSPSLAECLIHDSDIDNMNRAFWERSLIGVTECHKLGMFFVESEGQLGDMAERILRNN